MVTVKQALMDHLINRSDGVFPEISNEFVNVIAREVFERDPKYIMPLTKAYVKRELESLRKTHNISV